MPKLSLAKLERHLYGAADLLRREGMDASQSKDDVLFMLFIKYISDRCAGSDDFAPPVVIPKGAGFKDMVALKGRSDIGDRIHTQVIQPLIEGYSRLAGSDVPDFKNRAEHDDILGDAYEYLMRHFAGRPF